MDYIRKRGKGGGWNFISIVAESHTDVDNPYLELAAGILRQAKRDYIIAIIANDIKQMQKLERFFLSDWGQFLSFKQGEYIIKRSMEIAIEKINHTP